MLSSLITIITVAIVVDIWTISTSANWLCLIKTSATLCARLVSSRLEVVTALLDLTKVMPKNEMRCPMRKEWASFYWLPPKLSACRSLLWLGTESEYPQAILQEDGLMCVTQTWEGQFYEGTEIYIPNKRSTIWRSVGILFGSKGRLYNRFCLV